MNTKRVYILLILFLFTSCSSIKISPKNCQSDGIWGESKKDELISDDEVDILISKSFSLFSSTTLYLKDLLAENKVSCREVKSIKVKISTKYFYQKKVEVLVRTKK